MSFPYKLAVFDMDGTLLGPDRQLGRENVEAVHRLHDKGVEIVIASGRHHRNIALFEAELGFQGWVISAGGAVVQHAATQELLYEVTVPTDLGHELFQRGREKGISLIGYHRSGIFCDAVTEWISVYTRKTHQIPIADIPELIGTGLQKLIWTIDAEQIADLTPKMQKEFEGRLYVVNTEPEMLEFMHPSGEKARATQVLCEKLGIGQDEIIAFGDGNNDVPLLEWAGMSYAMAHGKDSAKKAAKRVSPAGAPETAVARAIAELLS